VSSRLVTLAEVAQLAGKQPSLLYNWRTRYDDFPNPHPLSLKGNEYDEDELLRWMRLNKPKISLSRVGLALRSSLDAIAEIGAAPAALAYARLLAILQRLERTGQISLDSPPSTDRLRQVAGTLDPSTTTLLNSFTDETTSRFTELLAHHDSDELTEEITHEIGQLTKRTGGEYFTGREIRNLLVALASPIQGRVLDPCAGSGSLLRAAKAAAHEPITMSAADIDASIAGTFDGYAHETPELTFAHADVLASDPFAGETFDRILIDPPLGGRVASTSSSAKKQREPLAWVTYANDHLAAGGTAAILTTSQPLAGAGHTDSGSSARTRQMLLRDGRISAIVTIPGLSPVTSMPLAIWVLTDGPRETSVVLVDATQTDPSKWDAHEDTQVVTDALAQAKKTPGVYLGQRGVRAISVSINELRSADAHLLPARWIDQATRMSPAEAATAIQTQISTAKGNVAAANTAIAALSATSTTGPEPEMHRWSVLENSALFVHHPPRATDDDEAVTNLGALREATDLPQGPGRTNPGDVIFMPTGASLGAAIDDHGGHQIAYPLISIQVDHPEGRVTNEILCAWLNSSHVRNQAVGSATPRVDVRSLEVPLFTAEQATDLTESLRAARKAARQVASAAAAMSEVPGFLIRTALSGVTLME